jgi:DNA-directed RNA polymerase subunit M/transcription elongation factor TFIIS
MSLRPVLSIAPSKRRRLEAILLKRLEPCRDVPRYQNVSLDQYVRLLEATAYELYGDTVRYLFYTKKLTNVVTSLLKYPHLFEHEPGLLVCQPSDRLMPEVKMVPREIKIDVSSILQYAPKDANVVTKRCPRCHKLTGEYSHQMQTRSADEGMTEFYRCSAKYCGHVFRG